jgi:uncharacterized protein YdhG (YjbR/CyaY superfamily)
MAQRKAAAKGPQSDVFTAEERAAMREHAREVRRSRGAGEADGERDVLEKIAEMPETDRVIAERLHALIAARAPSLVPRTWYGMPAYSRDGNVVVYFQPAHKFKARYATIGFSDKARLDDGAMWPVAFALTSLTGAEEQRIGALLDQAAG